MDVLIKAVHNTIWTAVFKLGKCYCFPAECLNACLSHGCVLYLLMEFCLFIWLVGLGRPIRRGLGGMSLIKWSPSGDYFIAAKLYCHLPLLQNIFSCHNLYKHILTLETKSRWNKKLKSCWRYVLTLIEQLPLLAVMEHFISGRLTLGHQNHGPQRMVL